MSGSSPFILTLQETSHRRLVRKNAIGLFQILWYMLSGTSACGRFVVLNHFSFFVFVLFLWLEKLEIKRERCLYTKR